MTQKRSNSLSIISFHKELTDKISLVDMLLMSLLNQNQWEKNIFGKFVDDDL